MNIFKLLTSIFFVFILIISRVQAQDITNINYEKRESRILSNISPVADRYDIKFSLSSHRNGSYSDLTSNNLVSSTNQRVSVFTQSEDSQTLYTSVNNITYGKNLEINIKNQLPCNIDKYMKYFRGSIAYCWNPSVEKVNRKTVVSLVLSRYGNIRKLEIIDSSGSDKFDKAVLRAINKATPFKTLPLNYTAKTLNLELIFQSNAKNTAHSALMQMLNTSNGPVKLQYEIPLKKK